MSANSTAESCRGDDLPQGQTDWPRLAATTDAEIEAQAREDGYDLHEVDWSAAEVVIPAELDAEEEVAKAALADAIGRILKAQGLTQVAAAERTGLAQPDVSNLVRGRTASFSLDRLTRVLTALGQDVEIIVRPATDTRRGHLRVDEAA
ncbi:MAG TPA: helix-turn-helix transcriptional regulator [Longimicrobiaceae bacterium]|nr:helix-turn-helix transcriptional regulator [Longimicrobiaceae bacterium]